MSRDFLFKTDEFVFSYRVAGVLIKNGKILLQRDKNGEYAVIGGHVSFMEQAKESLMREFREELHTQISVGHLLAVQENFFMWGDKPCHQVHFYYTVHLMDDRFPREGVLPFYDDGGQPRTDLELAWVPVEALKTISVYPREIGQLLEKRDGVTHFVSSELK